jgi:hypothetical protein
MLRISKTDKQQPGYGQVPDNHRTGFVVQELAARMCVAPPRTDFPKKGVAIGDPRMSDKSDIERARERVGKHPETKAVVEKVDNAPPKSQDPNIRPGEPEVAGEQIKAGG